MIGPVEHLRTQIAGLGIAPYRLVGGPRKTFALAFGAQHQAGEGEVEGAREPHQHHRGRADLGALDLADGGLGNPRALGEVSQGPAAAVALEPQAVGEPGAEIVYYSIHMSIIREIGATSSLGFEVGRELGTALPSPLRQLSPGLRLGVTMPRPIV